MPEDKVDHGILKRREELHHILDTTDGWAVMRQVESILTQMNLSADEKFADLSAGMKRRVLFSRAVAFNPDVLLLDEPTNHLDIDAIVWMEEFLLKQVKTLLFVTHDRAFVKKMANRIMELDRGKLNSYSCDYATYLSRRQAMLDAEEKQNAVFDKKLSQGRGMDKKRYQGQKDAKRGKSKALKKLREEFKARRQEMGECRI